MKDTRAAEEAQLLAERAAAAMFERDRASQALGMRLTLVRPGFAQLIMPEIGRAHV